MARSISWGKFRFSVLMPKFPPEISFVGNLGHFLLPDPKGPNKEKPWRKCSAVQKEVLITRFPQVIGGPILAWLFDSVALVQLTSAGCSQDPKVWGCRSFPRRKISPAESPPTPWVLGIGLWASICFMSRGGGGGWILLVSVDFSSLCAHSVSYDSDTQARERTMTVKRSKTIVETTRKCTSDVHV